MSKIRNWVAIALTLATTACNSSITGPIEGFPVVWMVQGCSPVDGVAVDLFLAETEPEDVTQPTYPHVRISIEASAEELAENSFSTQNDPTHIYLVQRCTTENQCAPATEATVEFDDNDGSTHEFSGNLEVLFPDGPSVRGSFQAHLHALLILCG